MNYWLFITTPDNWAVTKTTGILGVAQRHKKSLSRVQLGDKCLIYIKRSDLTATSSAPMISGEYEVTSSVYYDDKQIFGASGATPDEIYPLRIKLNSLTRHVQSIPFRPLVSKLSFIKNKEHWGGTLQGNALLCIPEQDYKTIASSL